MLGHISLQPISDALGFGLQDALDPIQAMPNQPHSTVGQGRPAAAMCHRTTVANKAAFKGHVLAAFTLNQGVFSTVDPVRSSHSLSYVSQL